MDSNGKNVKRLTNGGGDASPGWSPDGQTIVYSGYEHEEWVEDEEVHFKIFLISPYGTNLRKLAGDIPSTDLDPAWSPDSQRIAFVSWREDWTWTGDIGVMNADGTNQKRLTHNLVSDRGPAWSPDGSKIAFSSVQEEDFVISVMNADGTNRMSLTEEILDGRTRFNFHPAWSLDGRTIAYISGIPRRNDTAIHLMTADGVHLKRLSGVHKGGDSWPDWFDPATLAVASEGNRITIWGRIERLASGLR